VTGGIAEAPNDGQSYVRKSLAWIIMPQAVWTSDTPPTAPLDGALWWNSATALLYVYYQDPDGFQWVQVSGGGSGGGGGIIEAPTDSVIYGRKNAAWTAVPTITVGNTAPVSPNVNDVWIDTT
jgi:hypothetical protein